METDDGMKETEFLQESAGLLRKDLFGRYISMILKIEFFLKKQKEKKKKKTKKLMFSNIVAFTIGNTFKHQLTNEKTKGSTR